MSIAEHIAAGERVALTIASGSVLTGFADIVGWIDLNMAKMTAAAGFIYLLLLIFTKKCAEVRKNREAKIKARVDELEIESLRLRNLIMQRELREKQDDDQH